MSTLHASGGASGTEREPPSPLAARLVPYGFARSGQILVAQQRAEGLEVWISERTSQAAIAEVARNFGAFALVRVRRAHGCTLVVVAGCCTGAVWTGSAGC